MLKISYTRTLGLIFLALLTLAAFAILPAQVSADNFDDVSHSPDPVTDKDQVTVTVTVDDDSDIKKVEMKFCEDDVCYSYEEMSESGSKTYTGDIPKHSEGVRIGYHIKITYNDDSSEEYPSGDDYIYYTVQGSGGDDDGDSPFPGLAVMTGTLALAGFVVSRKKRN